MQTEFEQLRDENERLRIENEKLRQIVLSVNFDLRNPVFTASSAMELIVDCQSEDEKNALIEATQRAIKKQIEFFDHFETATKFLRSDFN